MEKPKSIQRFDLLFLGGYALVALSTLLAMRTGANPSFQRSGAVLGSGGALLVIAITVAIILGLWYLVSVKRSGVARWLLTIYVGITALAIVVAFLGITKQANLLGPSLLVNTLGSVAQVGSIVMLFQPDTKLWFAKIPAPLYPPGQPWYPPRAGGYPPASDPRQQGGYPPPPGGVYPPSQQGGYSGQQNWPPYPPQGQ